MCTDEELRRVADSLGPAVALDATGALGEVVRERAATSEWLDGPPPAESPNDAGDRVRVVAVDSVSDPDAVAAAVAGDGFVAAVVGLPAESALLRTARVGADATLLVGPSFPRTEGTARPRDRPAVDPAVGGAFGFARALCEPCHVNLDVADARTVFDTAPLAVFGRGTAVFGPDAAGEAVDRAFECLPPSVDASGASGVLVSVDGGPATSLEDSVATVRAVRGRVGPDAHIIWGSGVDERLAGRLSVDVVLAGVAYEPQFSAGDACPRCGVALSAYTLGECTTLSCDACGFADLSVSLD